MKQRFWKILSLFALTAFVVGASMGFIPVDMTTTLDLNVEWVKGFTAHTDGLSVLAETAGAGVATEALKKATDELKSELEKNSESLRTELKENLETQIKELDAQQLEKA